MTASTVLLALGTATAGLLSLAALGLALYALGRPQRELVGIQRKLADLGGLRAEWEDYRSMLDSLTKRMNRLKVIEEKRAEPTPEPVNGRRRSLTFQEVQEAKR